MPERALKGAIGAENVDVVQKNVKIGVTSAGGGRIFCENGSNGKR